MRTLRKIWFWLQSHGITYESDWLEIAVPYDGLLGVVLIIIALITLNFYL